MGTNEFETAALTFKKQLVERLLPILEGKIEVILEIERTIIKEANFLQSEDQRTNWLNDHYRQLRQQYDGYLKKGDVFSSNQAFLERRVNKSYTDAIVNFAFLKAQEGEAIRLVQVNPSTPNDEPLIAEPVLLIAGKPHNLMFSVNDAARALAIKVLLDEKYEEEQELLANAKKEKKLDKVVWNGKYSLLYNALDFLRGEINDKYKWMLEAKGEDIHRFIAQGFEVKQIDMEIPEGLSNEPVILKWKGPLNIFIAFWVDLYSFAGDRLSETNQKNLESLINRSFIIKGNKPDEKTIHDYFGVEKMKLILADKRIVIPKNLHPSEKNLGLIFNDIAIG